MRKSNGKRLLSLVLAALMVLALVPVAAVTVWAASTTYTIAGTAGLCGNAWKENDMANDMTYDSSVYIKVYSNIPAGSYEFKITKDHSWNVSYGISTTSAITLDKEYSATSSNANNIKFSVAENGSTVTITFNASTMKIKVNVEAPTTPVTYPDTIYFVNTASWTQPNAHMWSSGSSTNWPGLAMTKVEDNIWSITRASGATSIVFNAGNNQPQTSDLNIPTDGTNMYNYSTGTWSVYQPKVKVTINYDGVEQEVNVGDNVKATLGDTVQSIVGDGYTHTKVDENDVFPDTYTVYSSLCFGYIGLSGVDGTLTTVPGEQIHIASSSATTSFQWYLNGEPVEGDQISSTCDNLYTVKAEDVGKVITFTVCSSVDQITSENIYVISDTVEVSIPAVVGVGTEIQPTLNWDLGTFTYQWKRDGVAIEGATTKNYTTTDEDAGASLVLDVTYNGTPYSSNVASVDNDPPVISGVEKDVTYYTTQTATVTDDNLDTVTVNGEPATAPLTLAGNVDATYEIVATDKAGNEAKLTVTMKPIAPLADPIKDLTVDNVTLDDEDDVRGVMGTVEDVDTTNATDEEKAALDEILDKCKELLDRLEEMLNAVNTDAVMDTLDVTKDNVTPEDKEKLEQAKEDLENALEDYAGNLTEENVEVIENQIQRIEDALDALENAEAVKDAIDELPETAEPDNEDVIKALEDAKAAYDALTDHEKELVGDVSKLDKLAQSLVAYKLIKGDGSTWTKESGKELSFTANGAYSKFASLEIDGKTVDAANYTAASGSTVITLKASYLETLSVGKHTISVKYPDGAANGTFTVEKAPTNGSATTGDAVNLTLLAVLLIASAAGIVTTVSVKGKKQW